MLRTLDRVRPWNISGHVCHSCRLRLLVAQRQPARQQSTSSPSQANDASDRRTGIPFPLAEDGEDSWLSNYNSLNAKTPKSTKKKEVRQAGEREESKARDSDKAENNDEGKQEVKQLKSRRQSTSSVKPGGPKSHASEKPYDVRQLRVPAQRRSGNRISGRRRKTAATTTEAVQALLGQGQFEDAAQAVQALSAQGHIEDAARAEFEELMEQKRNKIAGNEEGVDIGDIAGQAVATDEWAKKDGDGYKSSTKPAQSPTRMNPGSIFRKLLFGKSGSKDTESQQNEPGYTAPAADKTLRDPSSMYQKMLSGSKASGSHDEDSVVAQTTESDAEVQSNIETTSSGTEVTAFGVNINETTPPGTFPERKIVSERSPGFAKSGDSKAATSTLAKLHDRGWNLEAVSNDQSETTFVKPKEAKSSAATKRKSKTGTKAEKAEKAAKAEKAEEAEKAEKAKLKRRERMKLEAVTKRGASKGKGKGKDKDEDADADEDTVPSKAPSKKKSSKARPQKETSPTALPPGSPEPVVSAVEPSALHITPLDIPQPPVPGLEYGLDRVLFNAGVYQLQDPNSRVFNFDPYLQKIMPVIEFDYNALKQYKTSSQDVALADLAKEHNKRYIGSTSSMTGTLGHFHYLVSAWRPLNLDMLSRGFPEKLDTFTMINRAPNAIFLRWKNGTYAIDADKEHDGANVLMMLGKSMEKLLTLPTEDFERYRKSDPREVSEEERSEPEAFQYTTMGDFLMRSQLDAYDSRLPGTGMFDLKTRAVVTIRHSTEDFERMTGYQIHTLQGRFESYEREYYDMMRSTMLKYMLQVRMGRMEGIFIAYHNVERIFGFQYVSLQEMDRALHGQIHRCLGDQEFKASLDMLNKVFDMATAKYPERSLRFHFETTQEKLASGSVTPMMWVFAEPMEEEAIERIQDASKEKIAEFERTMMGMEENLDRQPSGVEDADISALEAVSGGSNETQAAPPTDQKEAEDKAAASDTQPSKSTSPTTSSGDSTVGPLFIANILLESSVNGTVVDRPEKLSPKHDWKIEYLIQERPADAAMWARYEDAKSKRREIFEKAREKAESGEKDEEDGEDGEDAATTKKAKRGRDYLAFLGSMSEQGRKFRVKVDRAEAGMVPVVVGRPVGRAEDIGSGEEGVVVDGVEDYVGWLYRRE